MRKAAILLALSMAVAGAATAGAAPRATTFKYCTDPDVPADGVRDVERQDQSASTSTWPARSRRRGVPRRSRSKTAFPGLIPALNAKKCDAVISGIFVTPDRMKQAGVVPYMETHRVLIVKAGNPKHDPQPEPAQGPRRRRAGRDEVRGVPEGAEGEDRLHAAELSRRQRRGGAGAARPRRRGADAGHVVRVSRRRRIPGRSRSAYTFAASDTFGIYYRKGDAVGSAAAQGRRSRSCERTARSRSSRRSTRSPSPTSSSRAEARARELRLASLLDSAHLRSVLEGSADRARADRRRARDRDRRSASSSRSARSAPPAVVRSLRRGSTTGSSARRRRCLQLYFIWYALPQLWSASRGRWFTPFMAAWIALSLNEAAYMSEIIRAGLISVDPGQELAGRALGMSRRQILRRIIVPQAIRIVIPPTGTSSSRC